MVLCITFSNTIRQIYANVYRLEPKIQDFAIFWNIIFITGSKSLPRHHLITRYFLYKSIWVTKKHFSAWFFTKTVLDVTCNVQNKYWTDIDFWPYRLSKGLKKEILAGGLTPCGCNILRVVNHINLSHLE